MRKTSKRQKRTKEFYDKLAHDLVIAVICAVVSAIVSSLIRMILEYLIG